MKATDNFKHLHKLASGYGCERWSDPKSGTDDDGGEYFEILDSKGEAIIGEYGHPDEQVANYLAAASPHVICEAASLIDAQQQRIADLELALKKSQNQNVPAILVSDFQEFIYRVVSQVPFESAEWANQKARALMDALKSAQMPSEK